MAVAFQLHDVGWRLSAGCMCTL